MVSYKLKELEKDLAEATKRYEEIRKNPDKFSTSEKFAVAKTVEMLKKAIEHESEIQNSTVIKTKNGAYRITKIENREIYYHQPDMEKAVIYEDGTMILYKKDGSKYKEVKYSSMSEAKQKLNSDWVKSNNGSYEEWINTPSKKVG